jgi:hypothetical protein
MTEQPNETRDGAATPRRIPQALYSCCNGHCREDRSVPAEDLKWSDENEGWVCDDCWHDPTHGEPKGTLADEIDGHIAAAKAEREWMPMSEAPNDGRSVLLLLLYGQSYHVRVAYWADEPEAWESEETGHVFTQEAIRGWQPLPPADAAMKPDQTQA